MVHNQFLPAPCHLGRDPHTLLPHVMHLALLQQGIQNLSVNSGVKNNSRSNINGITAGNLAVYSQLANNRQVEVKDVLLYIVNPFHGLYGVASDLPRPRKRIDSHRQLDFVLIGYVIMGFLDCRLCVLEHHTGVLDRLHLNPSIAPG